MRSQRMMFLAVWCLVALAWCPAQAQINFPGQSNGGRPGRPGRPGGGSPGGHQSPRPIPPDPSQPQELSGCNCLPQGECPKGFGQLRTVCVTDQGGEGICCLPQDGVVLTRVGFAQSDFQPVNIGGNVVEEGVANGRRFFQDIINDQQERRSRGDFLARGDPARGHAMFFIRTKTAQVVHDLAYTIAQASREIAKKAALTPEQSFFGLTDVRTGSFQCPLNQNLNCDRQTKFRTVDGSCNNLNNPLYGRSETGFGRIRSPLYNDGIMEARTLGVDGLPLPNVRIASNNILIDVSLPDNRLTLGVMQWAQFMDHDLTHAPFDDMVGGEALQCCRNGQLVADQPDQCFPITIPANDAFYGPRRQRCLNFIRSMLALNDNCAFGPVEQLNSLTHWVDGSMIYGSTEEEFGRVSDLSTGFMKTSQNNLPPLNSSLDCDQPRNVLCFAGGDSRINEQPGLTVMHTLWVREHNRIAKILQRLNPHWNGERLFEETRRIVIAEVQHINYKEWLPIIVGPQLMKQRGLNTLPRGFRNTYDPTIKPNMFNEFATAAFRFGHSMVQQMFELISQTGRRSRIQLRTAFNKPDIVQNNPSLVESFVNSLTLQNIQSFDNFITQELSNHLFQTDLVNFGMDLMSLNLQRGRDHAISTYNQMREEFGLGRARSFMDLRSTTPLDLIRRIQTVYRNVDDIDLFIGGITEKPVEGGALGPTFANIIALQFQVVMNGDRFFYDFPTGGFTEPQLNEIRKISIAKIYCENSELKVNGEMQPLAFQSAGGSNRRVPCSQIPDIDFSVFKE